MDINTRMAKEGSRWLQFFVDIRNVQINRQKQQRPRLSRGQLVGAAPV